MKMLEIPIVKVKYEYIVQTKGRESVEAVFELIFTELDNNANVYSFKFQKDEYKK
jgi:hypothetical protein